MTDDEKAKQKKAVVQAAKPPDEEAKKAFETLTVKTLLFDAMYELNEALKQNRPLIISYKVPCPCGKPECKTKLAIQISPYTDVYYDALRSKH